MFWYKINLIVWRTDVYVRWFLILGPFRFVWLTSDPKKAKGYERVEQASHVAAALGATIEAVDAINLSDGSYM